MSTIIYDQKDVTFTDADKIRLRFRARLEEIGDELESMARSIPNYSKDAACCRLFEIAWDIKQVARIGNFMPKL